jgi:iron complex transport system substrate-binding protein
MAAGETVIDTKHTKNTKAFLALKTIVIVPFVSFVLCASFVAFSAQSHPQRIVSLVPALTEMLFAVGAGPQVVGVSSYDEYPPQVKSLPRVGALLDPDTERILSLKPDLVLTYGSQVDLQTQLRRASIPTFDYRHGGLDHIFVTIRQLGQRTGHTTDANAIVADLEARIAAVRARVAGRPRPRTLLVFDREARALRNIYVSGGSGFTRDMLVAAGGQDVFEDVGREALQATTETILIRAPDVILEIRGPVMPAGPELDEEIATWSRLASVPAVKNRRVYFITGQSMVVPGPRVADGIERMAKVLHP